MKRILLLLFIVATGAQAQQFSFEYWHKGKLVTETGDTLKGPIKYNMQNDVIQFQWANRIETFTPRKVIFCEIFDAVSNQYRQFFSLPYAASQGQYKAPILFELLEEGKITLLCREALEYKTYSAYSYYGSYTRTVLVYKYFLLNENGELQEFDGKKNDWIYMMGNKGELVQKYAKSNRLNFDDRNELTKIVAYYNSLF